MFINRKLLELQLKIVYYGPSLSGKTTNLEYIHAHTEPRFRGDLVSLKTRQDYTLCFDYLELELGKIKGLKPRFSLCTVPGQTFYAASQKLVLQGADGVVFVADSQASRLPDNRQAVQDLFRHLRELGYDPAQMPLVVQFNKRDLPGVMPLPLLTQQMQLDGSVMCFESVAIEGRGVFGTLKAIIAQVVAEVQSSL